MCGMRNRGPEDRNQVSVEWHALDIDAAAAVEGWPMPDGDGAGRPCPSRGKCRRCSALAIDATASPAEKIQG